MNRLLDQHGRALHLGEKLGEGGEGAVYRLATQRDFAVKVYHEPLPTERAAKIRLLATLAGQDVQHYTAWPAALVHDERGQPRGLILPVVEQAFDVHQLYSPKSRRASFPEADWRFLVHVATNVARAFGAVHQRGFVIGDVNHGSVLVARNGTVRLIDVDSFQVPVSNARPLLCTVGVPLFQPPELADADLSKVIRTPHHDAFGLAVLIFHLLLQGRHPYAGRYVAGEMPIERAIREHRFAYSANAAARQMSAPPHAVGLEILPQGVAQLFEAAFAPTAGAQGRPLAGDWVGALHHLGAALVACARSKTHHYAGHLTQCPSCRFEQQTGVYLFGVPIVSEQKASSTDAEYRHLLALVAAVPAPVLAHPQTSPAVVEPAPAAVAAAGRAKVSVAAYVIGALITFIGLVLLPAGLIFVMAGGLVLIVGHGASRKWRGPWIMEYSEARREEAAAVEALRLANTFPTYSRVRGEISAATREWDSIPGERTRLYQDLERNKRREQLRQHLEGHLIERARISGVGTGRLAMLAAYGIDTAADIDYTRVSQVPQFGHVLADRLVKWRRSVERGFVFDASKPLPREAVARVEKQVEDHRRRCVEQLRKCGRALRDASAGDTRSAQQAAHRLTAAVARARQAEADARAALGKLPA